MVWTLLSPSDGWFATSPAAGIISCSWFLNTVTPELEAEGLESPDVALRMTGLESLMGDFYVTQSRATFSGDVILLACSRNYRQTAESVANVYFQPLDGRFPWEELG